MADASCLKFRVCVYTFVCMFVCVYVSLYVRMFVCEFMYVCMYVCVCMKSSNISTMLFVQFNSSIK